MILALSMEFAVCVGNMLDGATARDAPDIPSRRSSLTASPQVLPLGVKRLTYAELNLPVEQNKRTIKSKFSYLYLKNCLLELATEFKLKVKGPADLSRQHIETQPTPTNRAQDPPFVTHIKLYCDGGPLLVFFGKSAAVVLIFHATTHERESVRSARASRAAVSPGHYQ